MPELFDVQTKGNKLKGPRRGHQQPVWPADCQCDDCIQFDTAVRAAWPVSGNRERQGAGVAQADFTGGVATPAFPGALCLQGQAQSDRFGGCFGGD